MVISLQARQSFLLRRAFCLAAPPPPRELLDPSLDHHRGQWLPQVAEIVVRSGDQSTLRRNLRGFLSSFLLRLSPPFVAAVLRHPLLLSHPNPNPQPALLFFRALFSLLRRDPPSLLSAYVSLVSAFAAADDKEAVRRLINNIQTYSDGGGKGLCDHLTQPLANTLIRALGGLGMLDELLWAWRAMKQAHIAPTLVTFNCLLAGLVNAGFVDAADKVFDSMPAADVQADVVSYNTLLKGYRDAGRVGDAEARFTEMQRHGDDRAPDAASYVTMMQCLYAEGVGSHHRCVALYHEMEERGIEVPPHAYALVVAALCKDRKPFEGIAVLDVMRQKECPVTVQVYTTLIDALAKCGREEDAMVLFEKMKGEGLEPDAVTFGAVMNCLCKAGKVEDAMELFNQCLQSGIRANAVFYSTLIDGYGKAGMADRAQELFNDMVQNGCIPDSFCYNALIDAFVRSKRIDDGVTLFKKMEAEGCGQTVYTYTMLIDGLFRERRNEEAMKLWNFMIDKGITPTAAAFRIMSTGLCLSGKFSRALSILDELAPMGVIPETAHEDMLNVLCKAGRFKQACMLADDIVGKEREIPGRVRTILINALRKAGNVDLALKLVHSRIGIGYNRFGSIKKRVMFETLFDQGL